MSRPPAAQRPAAGPMAASDDQSEELRFSRRLAVYHIGGILALILVVVVTVLWVSMQHNQLAKASSIQLVRGGISLFKVRAEARVRDDSVWDEAFAAATDWDVPWLYRNLGTAATDLSTLDMIVLSDMVTGENIGWTSGSPPAGEVDLLPAEIMRQLVGLLDSGVTVTRGRSTFLTFDGEPWIFAIATLSPTSGEVNGDERERMPKQIHGYRVSQEVIERIGLTLNMADLEIADAPAHGFSSIALTNAWDEAVAYVNWMPPRPGANILRRIAVPLGLALGLVAIIATVSSRFAVRAARRLEMALVQAQAADRSKTDFLSNVTHELRTPMNGIIGVAQLLGMTPLNDEQKELVSILSSSADNQMALISDLLDLTKVESGNRPLVNTRFEPAAVIGGVIDLMRPSATDKNLSLEVDLAGLEGEFVWGDDRAFRQIMTNLLGNACKFTDVGGVRVVGRIRKDEDHGDLEIEVTDTGHGIAEEHQDHIFDRFYQADASRTRQAGGTGLGLAISKSLAEMMGGRIEVRSVLGKGSTFTLSMRLPLSDRRSGMQDAA